MSPRQKPFYIVLIIHVISGSWKISNGIAILTVCILVPFHNLCNSVARDEQTTLETHRFP